ncbi:RNA polymerase sigma factor RpoH [Anaeromyxobacter oryzae]|uniref:RNA polymerase sigma factor RpoH n=2 Tax=Anaeromyxobacter oryzae TaxID=2918170 RepID=A0ABN6MZM1_9BACT|nr:RNA polymerase sigma factor RpoH [Anaeromyxobacter oryzae]
MKSEMGALAPALAAARARPPLSREAERALAARARDGDIAARDELVARHLPLVVSFVRKQARGTIPLDELVQEGNLGLVRAIEKFDPDAGTRFSTYAVWWIRAYVWRYLKQARSAVRPRSGTVALADLSLDSPLGEDGDVSYLDRIEDEGPGPADVYAAAEGDRQVRGALDRVRGRIGELGWDIIHTRLQQDPPDTLERIGQRWGVSRERVRQVETQTKRFLRGYLQPEAERRAA